MSVLVNLLPDLRLQKQRDKERRQLVTGLATLVLIACGVFVVLMLVITSGQAVLISSGKKGVSDKMATLSGTKGLTDALSAQARLDSLTKLYPQRTLITKLMNVFSEVATTDMVLSSFKYNTLDNSLLITGTVATYAQAAKLDRALEAAHLTIGTGAPTDQPYFTDIYLRSTSMGTNNLIDFTISGTVATGATHAN